VPPNCHVHRETDDKPVINHKNCEYPILRYTHLVEVRKIQHFLKRSPVPSLTRKTGWWYQRFPKIGSGFSSQTPGHWSKLIANKKWHGQDQKWAFFMRIPGSYILTRAMQLFDSRMVCLHPPEPHSWVHFVAPIQQPFHRGCIMIQVTGIFHQLQTTFNTMLANFEHNLPTLLSIWPYLHRHEPGRSLLLAQLTKSFQREHGVDLWFCLEITLKTQKWTPQQTHRTLMKCQLRSGPHRCRQLTRISSWAGDPWRSRNMSKQSGC
jgi:hypothetical protein